MQGVGKNEWKRWLEARRSAPYFQEIQKRYAQAVAAGKTLYPPRHQIFRALSLCPKPKTRVVILGQDPYHGPGQANGLAFSVNRGMAIPPSLQNIFKLLQADLPGFISPGHGDLTRWAQQGVLLLNAVLTVEAGQPQSHAGWGWEQLTDELIRELDSHVTPLVFLLWGQYAQRKAECLQSGRHLCLRAVHPSPLSAHRGFLTCGHFKQIESFFEKHQQPPIRWELEEKGRGAAPLASTVYDLKRHS